MVIVTVWYKLEVTQPCFTLILRNILLQKDTAAL